MMLSFNEIKRLTNVIREAYSHINNVNKRKYWPISIQVCNFTKEVEESVNIEKPKRPLNPFFKVMKEMRPVLKAQHPEKSHREILKGISDYFKDELDPKIKSQMEKEYRKDLKDYSVLYKIYKDSLPKKDDRMGRPKRPANKFLLFLNAQRKSEPGTPAQEVCRKAKINWHNLPDSERSKFQAQFDENKAKYEKDLQAWELKMKSEGQSDMFDDKKY